MDPVTLTPALLENDIAPSTVAPLVAFNAAPTVKVLLEKDMLELPDKEPLELNCREFTGPPGDDPPPPAEEVRTTLLLESKARYEAVVAVP